MNVTELIENFSEKVRDICTKYYSNKPGRELFTLQYDKEDNWYCYEDMSGWSIEIEESFYYSIKMNITFNQNTDFDNDEQYIIYDDVEWSIREKLLLELIKSSYNNLVLFKESIIFSDRNVLIEKNREELINNLINEQEENKGNI